MFDTNIFDRILDGRIDLARIASDLPLYVTHVQEDEIKKCSNRSRRDGLLRIFAVANQARVPGTCTVWGKSRWGSRWGAGRHLKSITAGNPRHIEDGMIGDAAIYYNLLLVTEDERLKHCVNRMGGKAVSLADFLSGSRA